MPEVGQQNVPMKTTPDRQIRDQHKDALRLLGYFLLRQARHKEAIEVYRGLLSLNPSDRQARRALIAAFLGEGRNAEALEYAEGYTVETGEPHVATIHLMRAQALWRLGRADEARSAVDMFLKLRQVTE
ncbi:MAG: tetratricopeptide repeat protein [Pseudomonadota bacterium]